MYFFLHQTEVMNISHKTNEYHGNTADGGHHKRSVDSGSRAADPHADPYGDHGHGYVFQVQDTHICKHIINIIYLYK